MSQNVTEFSWPGESQRAAELVAQDALTDEEIASAAKVTRRQLARWKKHPDFAGRVQGLRAEAAAAIAAEGIAAKAVRVKAMDDRWQKLKQVMAERAADPMHSKGAGGTTGLLVWRVRAVGSGDVQQIVDEWAVDMAVLRELRELEKAAADELGQRGPEGGGADGQPAIKVYVGISLDRV